MPSSEYLTKMPFISIRGAVQGWQKYNRFSTFVFTDHLTWLTIRTIVSYVLIVNI